MKAATSYRAITQYLIAVVWVLAFAKLKAQPPAGLLNTCTYNDKYGIENINWLYPNINTDGRLFVWPYGLEFITGIGNNYNKKIESNNNLIKSIVGVTTTKNNDEIWIWMPDGVAIVKNDIVTKKINYPEGYTSYNDVNNSKGFFILKKANVFAIAYFDGSKFLYRPIQNLTHEPTTVYDVGVAITPKRVFIDIFYHGKHSLNELISMDSIRHIIDLPKSQDVLTYDNYFITITATNFVYRNYANKIIKIEPRIGGNEYLISNNNVIIPNDSYKTIWNVGDTGYKKIGTIHLPGRLAIAYKDTISGYETYYTCAGNSLIRVFPYIKNYPSIYNGTNANGIFAIAQDSKGRIWAASYNNILSIIDNSKVVQLPYRDIRYLNGSLYYNDKLYFFNEGFVNVDHRQLLQFTENGKHKAIVNGLTGFYFYLTRNKKNVYLGTYESRGLWKTEASSLDKGNPQWEIIDSTKGMNLGNIITITEDTLGRIWCGQSGISVYNPSTGKATTWLYQKNEINIRAVCSTTDSWGTVWLGTVGKGLKYYDDYSKPIAPQHIKSLGHPMLTNEDLISSMAIWKNWLVLGMSHKICLFDLQQWHQNKKVVLRYLNPQEASFTGEVEQNVFLIDRRDSSLWFSTTDNLYQWDIKKWLSLPLYKVSPHVVITGKTITDTTLDVKSSYFLQATQNSFSLHVWFQTKDNMPRYMSTAFALQGDSILYDAPSLQTKFSYTNLAPGKYILHLRIFESDGTMSESQYTIIVKKFLWQLWWFWACISTIIIGTTLYFLNLRKRRQLAEQTAKTTSAELQTFRAEQEKKLADLRLSSLSGQFRPHFILNALNTIGAKMSEKPDAESVISRLGESVNLIFNHARQQKFVHSFSIEWELVTNVISIHRLMYLKELQTQLPSDTALKMLQNIMVPLGLLQIPVENALLHGLSNRLIAPWILSIEMQEDDHYFKIIITDNGVGRKKAATLSNYTGHGTGLRNLMEILRILNEQNQYKLSIDFSDNIFVENNETYGTKTIITLPKHYDYE